MYIWVDLHPLSKSRGQGSVHINFPHPLDEVECTFKWQWSFPRGEVLRDVWVFTLGFGSIKTNSGMIALLVWFKCECCHLHLGVQCAPNKPHHFRGSRSTSSWTLEWMQQGPKALLLYPYAFWFGVKNNTLLRESGLNIFLSIPEPTELNSKCKHTLKPKWNALIVMQGCGVTPRHKHRWSRGFSAIQWLCMWNTMTMTMACIHSEILKWKLFLR